MLRKLPGNVDHISEEVLNSLDRQIKTAVDPFLFMSPARVYSSVQFQVMPHIFLFIS
jgi:hypothetical protein